MRKKFLECGGVLIKYRPRWIREIDHRGHEGSGAAVGGANRFHPLLTTTIEASGSVPLRIWEMK